MPQGLGLELRLGLRAGLRLERQVGILDSWDFGRFGPQAVGLEDLYFQELRL